jgi:GNAT superfamily N-acetyltransferase
MTITYRPGTVADVPAAAELFSEAVLDLGRRNGLAFPPPSAPGIEPWYRHLAMTGVFEVATDETGLVAFASGIVRDGVFFLSMFWTRPARQRQGVGRPLLARVWNEARLAGAHTFAVWSSIDFAAIGTYLRTGMRPLFPILTFGGVPKTPLAIDAELAPLEATAAGELDRVVRGTARLGDHTFLLREKRAAHLVRREGRTLGYFYAHEGRVGPVAWIEGEGRRVLGAAIATTRASSEKITLAIPGANVVALDVVLELGLVIESTAHFLTTRPFGALDRYVPSGPALF